MIPPSTMNVLILDDLELLPPPQVRDIFVGPSRASIKDGKHTHAKNVKDIHMIIQIGFYIVLLMQPLQFDNKM
jgi:hypothetical protein